MFGHRAQKFTFPSLPFSFHDCGGGNLDEAIVLGNTTIHLVLTTHQDFCDIADIFLSAQRLPIGPILVVFALLFFYHTDVVLVIVFCLGRVIQRAQVHQGSTVG